MATQSIYEELKQKIKVLKRESFVRRRCEEGLAEGGAKPDSQLHNTPIGAIYWDLNFRAIEWNHIAEAIFGYSKEEALGKHAAELILPEELKEVVDGIFLDLISEKGGTRSTNENLTKDGRRIICDWYNTTLKDDNGKVVGVISLVSDITSRKRAEEALWASEKEYKSIINDLLVGVTVHASDTSILLSNPEATNILGLTCEEMLGKKAIDPFWNFVHEDSTVMKVEDYPVSKVLSTRKPIYGYFLGINKPDRDYITWVIVNAVPVFSDDGELDKIIVNFVDITARKQMEEREDKLEVQIRKARKMEAIGTLAGGIAHDFNNILGLILGYTELAKDDAPPDSQLVTYLERVLKAGHLAKELVKQILAFSRQAKAERIPIQLQSLIKEALKNFRSSTPESIEIYNYIDSKCGVVLADPTQIHQILMNLCANAKQAMETTGGILTIELKSVWLDNGDPHLAMNVEPGRYVELTVSDTGSGIEPDVIDKIFDPYFTTKAPGIGTGIGLAIIHGIISEYGGAITVESEVGKGTTFHVYFPVVEQEELPVVPEAEELPLGKERVLFIDDNELLVELGRDMLEGLGYNVTIRQSSIEALSTFQNNPDAFDIIITDQQMPGMTGSILASRMLQIRPDIPIILCTGYSDLIDERKAKSLGIKEFALKPLTKASLAKLVRKVLDGS